MDFVFNEEQLELRATARAFLSENSDSAHVRQAMESELGFDAQVWKQLSELGWLSVTIPEKYDGMGLSYVELAALMEVMGESLLCSPFLSTIGLAANADELRVADTDCHDHRAHHQSRGQVVDDR